MATYEVTLKMEVLGEFSTGVISDLYKFMDKNNIEDDRKNNLSILLKDIWGIKHNILKQETMEDILKIEGTLVFLNDYIKKLGA